MTKMPWPAADALNLASGPMDTSGTISFVWGYLPGIDKCSDAAAAANLTQRFSVVFDSWPNSAPEITFNKDLAVGTLNHLLRLFPHDAVVTTDWKGGTHCSLDEACLYDIEDKQWDPVESIRLTNGHATTCLVEQEPYWMVGGPRPYHDAFVYVFYCRNMDRCVVQDALFLSAMGSRALILDVVSGTAQPVMPSRWRRLLRWIR